MRYNRIGKGASPMSTTAQTTIKKPSSARRIAASRANGKLSRGPKTTAGKCRSSANNRQHGLATPHPGPTTESGFLALRASLIESYNPADPIEQHLVNVLATAK